METSVTIRRSCGTLEGKALRVSNRDKSRHVCYCDDCQTFAHYLGRAKEILDGNAGTEICALTPAQLKITKGVDQIRCVRLSPKGIFRWYAECCKSPIANTPPSAKSPYAGVFNFIMDHKADGRTADEALGPIISRVKAEYGVGILPPNSHKNPPLSVIFTIGTFMLKSLIKGEYAPSPFIDALTKKPIVEPIVISKNERNALRNLTGPKPAIT